MENKRLCNNCKFCMLQDTGYSNYTVTNTIIDCLHNNNEYFPTEESYSWEREDAERFKELRVAETCEHYVFGDGLHFDVDGDRDETMDNCEDEELKTAYDTWNNS